MYVNLVFFCTWFLPNRVQKVQFWTQFCLLLRTILFSVNTKSWNSLNFQTHERSYDLIFSSDCQWNRSLFHHNDETWLFRMTKDDLTSNRVVRLLIFKIVTTLAPSSWFCSLSLQNLFKCIIQNVFKMIVTCMSNVEQIWRGFKRFL